MSCTVINLTKEEVTNLIINKEALFELTPEDTVEDILNRYKFLQNNMLLPEGDNARYSIFDNILEERFSNIAKRKYESRIGKEALERSLEQPDFIKKKDAGSRTHEILAELMQAKLGRGTVATVKEKASKGDYAITGNNFKELINLVDEIYEDIQNIQRDIDPKGKVTILVEQRIVDPVKNMGGTMDIHAVFSNGTGLIYDYKTTHSNPESFQNNELVDDLLHENKIADNELTMAEYKRVAMQRMGVKKIIQTRLIPIHLRLGMLPESQQSDFNYRNKKIDLIEAGSRTGRRSDEFLKPIPVAGEETKYAGINDLLEKQFNLLKNLTDRLEGEKLSMDDRDRLNQKVKSLRRAIRHTITNGDIYDIIDTANNLVAEINDRVHIPKLLKDGTINPLYLMDNELKELLDEIKVYSDIIDNISLYYRDLQESDPEEFDRLRKEVSVIGSNVSMALTDVKQELQKRTLEYIDDDDKTTEGGLKPLTELDYATRNATRISEIDHPIFRAAWQLIQDKLFDQREELKKISNNIDAKDKAVALWAKSHNVSKISALRKLIDFSTGNLIHKVSKSLVDKINSAYSNPSVEKGYEELRKYLQIADEDKFKELYKQRYETFRKRMAYRYAQDKIGYQKAIDSWKVRNDLLTYEDAWINKYNRKYLSYKKSVEEENLSDEYKVIMNEKPLLDYYEMYIKYNIKFRDVLGISQYNKLPINFIPNIRKTLTDSIAFDNIGSAMKYIATEFWDSFNVREEDIYISDIDQSGDLKRTIPILFLNPLRNKDGNTDNTKKSYDLSKNLMIFAKMAYNYQTMSEIEPTIIGMRELMAYPTSDQGGTQVLDSYGRKIRGHIKEYATKKGFDTDTYKLFEDITDFYLYGIKFKKENSLGNSAQLTKFILRLKQYYAKKALSFAIIPGLGAYIAGNVSGFFEGVKGVNYTKENILTAMKNLGSDFKKYKSLALMFDVYAEDPINVLEDVKSAKYLTKFGTTRNMFYPLRKTDENINDAVLNRMALNWGVDVDGKLGKKGALIRLNRPDIDTTGLKNLWELTSTDKKTGKLIIEGITDKDGKIINKEAFIAFRTAVKSTSASIIGSLSQEDISRTDVVLVFNIMAQFKTWMAGLVQERFGKLRLDKKTQSVRWGRYAAAFAEYGLTSSEREGAQKINNFISQILLPNMGRTVLDLMTFGIGYKTGLAKISHEYINPKTGKKIKIRSNEVRAKRMYYDWLLRTGKTPADVSFELFLETKEAQMRAMINEMRAIMMFISTLLFLGADGTDEDGSPRYMENYLTRLVYKSMSKANSELTFMWSPAQMSQIIKNPIPMSALFTDVLKLFKNTFDEGRDVVFGENSPYDRSPMFFYTMQMAYGGNQLARFLELYKQYEKNPYPVIGITGN